MNHLVQYARKVEGDMYDTAASRVSYVAAATFSQFLNNDHRNVILIYLLMQVKLPFMFM